LVLLGAVVVVDRVEHAGGLLGRGAQQQGGLAAVRADLDADAAVEVSQRGLVQRPALVGRHETLDLFGQRKQTLRRIDVGVTHRCEPIGSIEGAVIVVDPSPVFSPSERPRRDRFTILLCLPAN
jgi:hypothetical protein